MSLDVSSGRINPPPLSYLAYAILTSGVRKKVPVGHPSGGLVNLLAGVL